MTSDYPEGSPSSVRTRGRMPFWNPSITASIFGWYAETCEYLPQQVWVYRVYGFRRSMKHTSAEKRASFSRSSSWSRRTTNSLITIYRACQKPRYLSVPYPSGLTVESEAGRDIVEQNSACMSHERDLAVIFICNATRRQHLPTATVFCPFSTR